MWNETFYQDLKTLYCDCYTRGNGVIEELRKNPAQIDVFLHGNDYAGRLQIFKNVADRIGFTLSLPDDFRIEVRSFVRKDPEADINDVFLLRLDDMILNWPMVLQPNRGIA